jgi:MSHA biogenesis protein MshP
MKKSQQGFSLITALFLIVVVSLLVAVGVRIGLGSQQTLDGELLGARALAAADAGIEWAAHRALVDNTCASTTLNLSEAALQGFRVDVTCSAIAHTVGADTIQVYALESFAAFGVYGQPGYTSRRVRAQFTKGDT